MATITGYQGISSGQPAIASQVSTNFTIIAAAINNNNLDANNYGSKAIVATHIADDAIDAGHIAATNIRHAALQFESAHDGCRVLRIGTSFPANGLLIARYSHSIVMSNTASASTIISWTQGIDGNPAFTATPHPMGVPVVNFSNTDAEYADGAEINAAIISMNSAAVSLQYNFNTVATQITATAYLAVIGAI